MLSSTTYIDKGGRPALLSLLPFQRVDFYGNYSFRYLWQKRLHFWSYSHHPFYLQRGALSIKHDLQTRPRRKWRSADLGVFREVVSHAESSFSREHASRIRDPA